MEEKSKAISFMSEETKSITKSDGKQPCCSTVSGDKPIILTFIGNYLPGFKAGGILRVVVNTVDHLCDEFDFRIVTRDRDLGDVKPYSGIKINEWQKVGNATVYYLSPQSCTTRCLLNLIMQVPHHVLYLNSFFDPFTVKALWNRKFRRVKFKAVIVAPWGEFAWASLKQKYLKKIVFIQLARLIGLYNNVTWRASSEFEKKDIVNIMKINPEKIHIAGDFPIKQISDVSTDSTFQPLPDGDSLKIVFLSRISREKNLDYALMILKKVKASVIFDIYGPAENEIYWKECQKLIRQMPVNVQVNYLGRVDANQVVQIFSRYDLFLFPTGGEAYGHVIAECLTAGTPVLISTETPWRNMQEDGFGWDIDLAREDAFVDVIDNLAKLSYNERLKKKEATRTKIVERLADPAIRETNRQLFLCE